MMVNEEESSVGKRKNSDLKKFDYYIIFYIKILCHHYYVKVTCVAKHLTNRYIDMFLCFPNC